ncbi:MAG: carboxymuconolactone decarboxylase family protein [Desulfurococcales archaeon]|nr:carboxymuconolactone decarboxylase family protein [Desulfurococcales archaeon]
MEELLREFYRSIVFWRKTMPEQTNAFMKLLESVDKPGALDTKTKELIAVAASVASQCKWCIAFHVKKALECGASPNEIREASWVAVVMAGGPALAHMQLVEKALEEFSSKKS